MNDRRPTRALQRTADASAEGHLRSASEFQDMVSRSEMDYSSAGILCRFFNYDLRLIQALDLPSEVYQPDGRSRELESFKKALIVTHIDSLAAIQAAIGMGNTKRSRVGNKDRFLTFVRDHGQWLDGALVSLPILSRQLAGRGLGKKLLAEVKEHLKKVSTNGETTLAISRLDLSAQEVEAWCESSDETRALEDAQHYRLLYEYRNYLLHEFRSPGSGVEGPSNGLAEPYYWCTSKSSEWYLAYPLEFFVKLAERCIPSFYDYLQGNNIDPYDYVRSSASWTRNV